MLGAILPMFGVLWGYSIGEVAITIVIVAAMAALVYLALRYYEITIPPFFVKVFWILIVAFVVIAAIRLLMSM